MLIFAIAASWLPREVEKCRFSRKIYLWPAIAGSNIDLREKQVTNREYSSSPIGYFFVVVNRPDALFGNTKAAKCATRARVNTRPAGGGGGGQNLPTPGISRITPKPLQISTQHFCVPYATSLWHRMTKFGRNRSETFWEIDVFVGSLHANFDQNRLNVKKFAKNRVLKQTAQKDQ